MPDTVTPPPHTLGDPPSLPDQELSALAKQHAHDLRNLLNGMGMDLALVAEMAKGPDQQAAVDRMRQSIKCAESLIRSYFAKFVRESRAPICVADAADRWVSDVHGLCLDRPIDWSIPPTDAIIEVESGLLRSLLTDLILLASKDSPRKPLRAGCTCREGQAIFEVVSECEEAAVANRNQLQQSLWSAARHLGLRLGGTLDLPPLISRTPIHRQLRLPLLSTSPAGIPTSPTQKSP